MPIYYCILENYKGKKKVFLGNTHLYLIPIPEGRYLYLGMLGNFVDSDNCYSCRLIVNMEEALLASVIAGEGEELGARFQITFSGEFNTDIPLGSVNAKIKNLKSSGSQKEFLVTFEGNREKIDPNLLKTSLMFSHDSLLNSIFQSQCSQNKIESYTLKNTYNETYDFDFDLAGRYLVYKVDLKAEYQEAKNIERLFHVEFSKKS